MKSHIRVIAVVVVACNSVAAAEPPKSREFLFHLNATISDLKPGQAVRVWIPVPPSNEDQDVREVRRELPAMAAVERESKYGNQVLSFEAEVDEKGSIAMRMTYRVNRREVGAAPAVPMVDPNERELFLKPDARVPVGGKPLMLLKDKHLPAGELQLGRALYDIVNTHMRYSKEGTEWGRGDAEWACNSGFGNCSDFHSLFISLARSKSIPAKFEIGFSIPLKRGTGVVTGYHCWAKFLPSNSGWVPVDISEANKEPKMKDYYFGHLTADRVMLSTGRDLTLAPKQAGPPLNFFVYPYAEADGKPVPEKQWQRNYSYEDVGKLGK